MLAAVPAARRLRARWWCPVTRSGARLVLLAWVCVAVAGGLAAPATYRGLREDGGHARTEASAVAARLRAVAPTGQRLGAVLAAPAGGQARLAAAVDGAASDLRARPDVVDVLDLPDAERAGDQLTQALLSADDRYPAQLLVVDLVARQGDRAATASATAVRDRLHRLRGAVPGATVQVGGSALVSAEANAGASADLARAELVTLPLVLLAGLLLFGGLLAALLPVLTAVASAGGALLGLLPLSRVAPVSSYAANVTSMLALALAVDYGLLLLSRFRDERHAGHPVAAAVALADATAGRTTTYSALTVVAALSGLLVLGDPTLRATAVGAALALLISLVAARTLTPALLLLLGDRLRLGRPLPDDGRLARLAWAVVRRRVPVLVGTVALLLAAAVPVLHLRLTLGDARVLPRGSESRQVADQLDAHFPGRLQGSVTAVASAPTDDARVGRWVSGLAHLPASGGVRLREGFPAGLTVVDVDVRGDPQGARAQALVRQVRAQAPGLGFPVAVGGPAATLLDVTSALRQRLALAITVTALATALLLLLMTRSLVVPVKAVVVAALSLTASLGALVAVAQQGHLAGVLGVQATGSLQAEVPLVLVVLAFGLSVDYEVFLLARVQEAWLAGAGPTGSVAVGLQRSGRVIGGAALLVVLVFAGFAAGDVVPVQQLGLGLAVAVTVDATLVRLLLVSAVMSLLGARSWWAPAALARRARTPSSAADSAVAPARAVTSADR